jgi:hypothetical protein
MRCSPPAGYNFRLLLAWLAALFAQGRDERLQTVPVSPAPAIVTRFQTIYFGCKGPSSCGVAAHRARYFATSLESFPSTSAGVAIVAPN